MARKPRPWYRTSTGEWYATMNGKQEPLGVHNRDDEAAAWAAMKNLISKALAEEPGAKPGPIAAQLPDYIETLGATANPKTVASYTASLRAFVARFGNCAAGEIDPKSVEMHASAQGWSDSHKANYLWTAQAFVRWCGRKDFSLRRPAKDSRGASAVITEDTHRLILRETRGDFHELCRFWWAVGCRPMEGARITVDMVDWASGTVTLKQHKTRHKGKRRILYLTREAIAILQAQRERYGSGHLFRGIRGEPFTIRAIVGRMMGVAKKIGRPVSAYCYRHTFATRALSAGIPDTHVAALLGHTSTAMVHRHYSHVSENARLLREAAEKLAG